MVLALTLIVSLWVAAAAVVIAMCVAAARGDAQLEHAVAPRRFHRGHGGRLRPRRPVPPAALRHDL